MEEKKINEIEIKHPKGEMVPVTIREVVIGDDGKTHEIEKTVMLPKLIKRPQHDANLKPKEDDTSKNNIDK